MESAPDVVTTLHLSYQWRRFIAYAIYMAVNQSGLPVQVEQWAGELLQDLYTSDPPIGGDCLSHANIARVELPGTQGGTNISKSWEPYPLNTVLSDAAGIVTLLNNQFQISSGEFDFDITVGFFNVGRVRIGLYNVTQAMGVRAGMNIYPGGVRVTGREVSNGTDWYEIQYYAYAVQVVNGLGIRSNSGDDELYADVHIYLHQPT